MVPRDYPARGVGPWGRDDKPSRELGKEFPVCRPGRVARRSGTQPADHVGSLPCRHRAAIYDVSATRWAALLICGCVVLSGETLNTSIETLVDYVQHECDGDIRTIKDLAAGAVLLTAELAGAVGVIVFWPYVIG
jgi:hypothetical protein